MTHRLPELPPPVREWCTRYGAADPETGSGSELVSGALNALEEARARPGRDREGAFALLAADALLTYAAEDAARARDPDAELRELLRLVAGVGSG